MTRALPAASLALVLVAGCDKSSSSAGSAPTTTATTTASHAASDHGGAPAAHAEPAALPAGRTPMPTLAEWNGQRKEVTVKGSSALKCETKTVREYLRISCRDKNDSGGTPTTIQITKGGRDALTFAAGGVTSLIVPYVEGTHLEAVFSWTDKSFPLTIDWPKGNKMPVVLGAFAGAKSPLDGTASGDAQKLCECHKKVNGSKTCEDLFGAPDPDCDRTYGSNCEKLLQCSRGEPGVSPSCLPGFINTIPTGRCSKLCKTASDCPKGSTCDVAPGGKSVCQAD